MALTTTTPANGSKVGCPSTDDLRRDREKRAALTSKVSVVARGTGYAARLIVIPLSLKILGAERYGLWLTVGSLMAWLQICDFGISRGLVNAVAEASGRNSRGDIQRLVATGFLAFAGLSLIVAALVISVCGSSTISQLLHVEHDSALARDAKWLVLICGLYFALSFSFQTVSAVCDGLQEGYLNALFQGVGSFVSVSALLILSYCKSGIIVFALTMAAPGGLCNIALGAYVFLNRHRDLRPRLALTSWRSFRSTMNFGVPLMVVQFAGLATLYSANLLIANRLGPAAVPSYSIPLSIFMIVVGMCHLLAQPYIAAYAEAFARADYAWIRRRALRLAVVTIGVMTASGLSLALLGPTLVRWWTSSTVIPGARFMSVLAVYATLNALATANGMLLIGIGAVRSRAALSILVAGLFVGGTWALLPTLGVMAPPAAGVVAFLTDAAIALPYGLTLLQRKATAGNVRTTAWSCA